MNTPLLIPSRIRRFQKKIFDYYDQHGRHDLPWRIPSRTPYQVLVSELMLQQTQVERVIPFFRRWTSLFPNWKKLAEAGQGEVLRAWKGLGYNTRALRLQCLARVVVSTYKNRLPRERSLLEDLPGIGPYTAGAIRVFAFGISDVFIETNIRRVFIHEFFEGDEGGASDQKKVTDKELLFLLQQTLPSARSVEWYSGLMDYGASLPKILKRNSNSASVQYKRQSVFVGSNRQLRGRVLDFLLDKKVLSISAILKRFNTENISCDEHRLRMVLGQLEKEGFLYTKDNKVFLK